MEQVSSSRGYELDACPPTSEETETSLHPYIPGEPRSMQHANGFRQGRVRVSDSQDGSAAGEQVCHLWANIWMLAGV